jgi:hypothetical protein
MPSLIFKPRYLAMDSSHLGQWVRDRTSPRPTDRAAAADFERWLEANGYVLFLCLHHLEELVRHEDRRVALSRLRFIGSLKFLAWIGSAHCDRGLGTVVTMLAEEARAAMENPGADAVQVRDLAASRLIRAGTGEDAIGPDPDIWLLMQPVFAEQSEGAQQLMAFSRSNLVDIADKKISELMTGGVRRGAELDRALGLLRGSFATDIAQRGDRRIEDPHAMAAAFVDDVHAMAQPLPNTAAELVLRCLAIQGVGPDDIKPESTVGEMLNLGVFRSQLRIVAESLGRSPGAMNAAIGMDQLPSWIIGQSLQRHAPDLPERRGSEINDGYLACLCAYADVTFVDKRTLENFRRALPKEPLLERLARRVERASSYRAIPATLEAGRHLA